MGLARFKVCQEYAPRFFISYMDKEELYHLFMKKIDELGIPRDNVYFIDGIGDVIELSDAESLLKTVKESRRYERHSVKIYVCDDNDTVHSSSDCEKLAHEQIRRKQRNRNAYGSRDHHDSRGHFLGQCPFRGRPWHPPGFYQGLSSHYDHNCIDMHRSNPFCCHVHPSFDQYSFIGA